MWGHTRDGSTDVGSQPSALDNAVPLGGVAAWLRSIWRRVVIDDILVTGMSAFSFCRKLDLLLSVCSNPLANKNKGLGGAPQTCAGEPESSSPEEEIMGQFDPDFRIDILASPSSGKADFDRLRSGAHAVHELSGREKQVTMLLAEHRHVRKVARLAGINELHVRDILARVRRKLKVRHFHEIVTLVRASQSRWERTPALVLYAWAQRNIIGATIRSAVVQDSDWFGLLLEMPNGEHSIAWLLSADGDWTGDAWIEIE